MKIKNLVLSCLIFSIFPLISHVKAEPWVDASNIFLRVNIQRLADLGIITTPVTTFPLMWHDIVQDLKVANIYLLTNEQKNAYYYVKNQYLLAKNNQKKLSVSAATNDNRFTSYSDTFRDNNSISVQSSFMSDTFAANITTSYTHSPQDKEYFRLDGTYVAAFVGNWVFSAGMQDRWWGPGWDTSLSMSNNARPMPTLSLSRKSAQGFQVPFTEHSIPWTVTTFMGVMDDERFVKDTLLWGFRVNFKPAKNWEIGISRLAQWAGDGRPNGLDTFLKVLKGEDNCGGNGPTIEECANGEEPGNQLAGYDIRYANQILGHPIGVYFTMFAEDGDRKGGLSVFGEERYQLGVDTNINFMSHDWRLYVEATDTYAQCKDGVNGDGTSNIGDCYYEHGIYKTGMRYNGRSIGSIYENDATTAVVGLISQGYKNTNIELKFRWLQLNKDNSDRAPGNTTIGNTVTEVAEDVLMLSGKVQHSYRNFRFTLGGDLSQSTFDNDIKNENNINVFFNMEYNL
jgi:hypothetical protein